MSLFAVFEKLKPTGQLVDMDYDALCLVSPPEAHEEIRRLKCKVLPFADILKAKQHFTTRKGDTRDLAERDTAYINSLVTVAIHIDEDTPLVKRGEESQVCKTLPESFLNELVNQIEKVNQMFAYEKPAQAAAVGESKPA